MLSKQESLIEHFKAIYQNSPFIITFKDPENLEFLYCNDIMLNFVGANDIKSMLGKTDYDFRWEKFAFLYEKHERDAVLNNIYPAIYPGCDHNGVKTMFICYRTPFFDDKKNVLGVLTHTYNLNENGFFGLDSALTATEHTNDFKVYSINKTDKFAGLTNRERECLFYFLRGKTCKLIGKILGISHRTAESYIDNVKDKLHVSTKGELISHSIENGYFYDIPASLLNKKFSDSLKES